MAEFSNAELLRAVGRLLDREAASRVKMRDDGDHLVVMWLVREGEWDSASYRKGAGLDTLRDRTPLRPTRSPQLTGQPSRWEELLRTLGQELDREGIRLTELMQAGGFEVAGRQNGAEVRRWYSHDELQKRSDSYRLLRRRHPRRLRWWRRLLGRG